MNEITRAGKREWIGLGVLALACLLYAMDLTVLHLAVPSLSATLEPTSTQLLWIIDIYGFLVAGSLIIMGTLGDRIGRRRLLMIGAASFGAISVIAAFSPTPETLIASRALMGIAGATLAPSTLSLLFNMFPDPSQRSVAIGVWIAAFSAGGAVGPVIGGFLLEHYWWGSVFLLALPVMALLLVLGPRVLPEYRAPEPGRLDITSAALSLLALLALIFTLKEAAQGDFGPLVVASAAVGVALSYIFVRRQRRLQDPLIDLELFRLPAFSTALGINVAGIFMMVGTFLFVAQYLQLVIGLSPLQAGLWSLPHAAGFIIGSTTAPKYVHRFRPALVLGVTLTVVAFGLALLATAPVRGGLGVVVISSVIAALGLAPALSLTTELVVGNAPPEKAGLASGISETGAELGGSLGIAILGSIGTALYRGRVGENLPSGMTPEAAGSAMETLGGAVTAAASLPAEAAALLLEVARGGFVDGMRLAAAVSAVVAIAAAVVATVVLRRVRPASPVEHRSLPPDDCPGPDPRAAAAS